MALHKRDAEFSPNQTAVAASTKSALLGVLLVALGILFVWYAANALLVIFAGILLAVFLHALSESLRRFIPVSARIATVVVIVVLVACTVAGAWLLAPRLAQQAAALYENLPRATEAIANRLQQLPVGNEVTKFIPQFEDILRHTGGLMAPASWLFSTSLGLIVRLVIILFVGVYLALDPQRYVRGLLLLTPSKNRARAKDVLQSMAATLRRWTLARMLLMVANAIFTSTGLWLLDIPFALTLGLIAGLLNFIPNVGPIIASIPAILIGLLESPSQAVYVAMLYLALQAADGYVFTPLVQQKAVNLPPALTIAAQLLTGVLLGAWGLVLATPLLAASVVLIDKLYVKDRNGESPPGG